MVYDPVQVQEANDKPNGVELTISINSDPGKVSRVWFYRHAANPLSGSDLLATRRRNKQGTLAYRCKPV